MHLTFFFVIIGLVASGVIVVTLWRDTAKALRVMREAEEIDEHVEYRYTVTNRTLNGGD